MTSSSSPRLAAADRLHYMFTWPCGCPFSVMTEGLALDAIWLEAFETNERIAAARQAGVKLHRIGDNEWQEVHQVKFGQCDHNPPELPKAVQFLDEDLVEMVVDDRVTDAINARLIKLGQSQNVIGARIGHLLKAEEPFDVRLAVEEIVKALSDVLEVG